jgi:hypothetical protein
MRSRDTLDIDCVGTRLVVPREVFAPVEPFLLANAVATRFISDVRGYLRDDGRVLIHFGTSADLAYLHELIDEEGFSKKVVAEWTIAGEWPVSYFVFRLARPDGEAPT